jgi:hypothetical protein
MWEHDQLRQILKNTEIIMSTQVTAAQALADLQNVAAGIVAQNTTLTGLVTSGIAQLTALLQNAGVAAADIETAIAPLQTVLTSLTATNAQIAALEANPPKA